MVKVGAGANYFVRARRYAWDAAEPEEAALGSGIFTVDLQHTVDIAFVPDISGLTPPWTDEMLPPPGQPLTTPEQVRLSEALLASYVVTPHPTLAGIVERFTWSPDGGPREPATVFYLTGTDFDRLADLVELTEIAGAIHSAVTVDTLRDHEAIRFVEQRIVDSAYLRPRDADMLGRS